MSICTFKVHQNWQVNAVVRNPRAYQFHNMVPGAAPYPLPNTGLQPQFNILRQARRCPSATQ